MNTPLITPQDWTAEKLAKVFDNMATKIRLNEAYKFGGATVIVPPQNGGEIIETLILDMQENPVQFWLMVKTKAEHELNQLDTQSRQAAGFPRR